MHYCQYSRSSAMPEGMADFFFSNYRDVDFLLSVEHYSQRMVFS